VDLAAMKTALFDFDLPPDRIAVRPVSPRDSARLLVISPYAPAPHEDRTVRDLPDLLRPGDTIVVNDTRVIPARLLGYRTSRATQPKIEVTLHQRLDERRWLAFARPAKKLAIGDTVRFVSPDVAGTGRAVEATVESKGEGGEVALAFAAAGTELDDLVRSCGIMPLPPYIASRRQVDAHDVNDYQTMFAQNDGSVAAPTAGLHFTEDLITRLRARGVTIEPITLHVGAGTFLPVHAEDTSGHKMHSEWATLTEQAAARLNAVHAAGGRILAVGSTSLRVVESATGQDGTVRAFSGTTDIFITPGYEFKAVDLMLTNFHLPRSTLFMLVCAFSGLDVMKEAYAYAIAKGYRFYSYGDACLLHRR
jgi:S-adenosylmethionine:tRNA ribosyltransferase-isomerase